MARPANPVYRGKCGNPIRGEAIVGYIMARRRASRKPPAVPARHFKCTSPS
jgi:hypothetical protein